MTNENKHRVVTLIQSQNTMYIFYNSIDENNQIKIQGQIFTFSLQLPDAASLDYTFYM